MDLNAHGLYIAQLHIYTYTKNKNKNTSPCNAKTGCPLEYPHALPAMCPHGTLMVTIHTIKTTILLIEIVHMHGTL